jgi:putative ABC transport system ATP-binding protein
VKVRIQALEHVYGARREQQRPARAALDIAHLELESRSHVCLVGSSGSGKSTLLNILAGVLVPRAGDVYLDETNLFSLNEARRDTLRSRSIGCVFQTLNLLQGLSALENLTLAQRFAGISAAEARKRAHELLEMLGLLDRAGARPSELSVGEQQRVAIARAVSKRPALVLADEPTASLDDENARAAIDLLLQACATSTLIVATHDSRLTSRFSSVCELGSLSSTNRDASCA